MDLFYQIAVHECIKTVVNRCQRNGWHVLFDASEDLVGRGVIPFREDGIVDDFSLTRRTKP